MEEPTPDMLPDASQTNPASTPAVQETVSEDVQTPVSAPPGPIEDSPADTEPNVPSGHVPYSRLKEEIKKRKELEEQLQDLQESETPEPDDEVNERIKKLEEQIAWGNLLTRFPAIGDHREEFDAWREEQHPTMGLENAAKLYLVDNDLIVAPERKGLEKTTAGPKTAAPPRYTKEEVDTMRINEPDKWMKLNVAGAFDDVTKW